MIKTRLPGCEHTAERMEEWCNEGGCPVCLTASLLERNETIKQLATQRDSLTARVKELEFELSEAKSQ